MKTTARTIIIILLLLSNVINAMTGENVFHRMRAESLGLKVKFPVAPRNPIEIILELCNIDNKATPHKTIWISKHAKCINEVGYCKEPNEEENIFANVSYLWQVTGESRIRARTDNDEDYSMLTLPFENVNESIKWAIVAHQGTWEFLETGDKNLKTKFRLRDQNEPVESDDLYVQCISQTEDFEFDVSIGYNLNGEVSIGVASIGGGWDFTITKTIKIRLLVKTSG